MNNGNIWTYTHNTTLSLSLLHEWSNVAPDATWCEQGIDELYIVQDIRSRVDEEATHKTIPLSYMESEIEDVES